MMYDAVFISDLHLNPDQTEITERFIRFLSWAETHTRSLYILGDFFHVWAGDDTQDEWSDGIAQRLSQLANHGVKIFYMHGNRDFLLGKQFATRASITVLSDPTVIELNGERILLTHGDRYCTRDRGHQWLRCITRNRWFAFFFLCLPVRLRTKLVAQVRQHSQQNKNKTTYMMDIVPSAMIADMQKAHASMVIHGHIHQPGLTRHALQGTQYDQYVLSDWDDNPQILCYYVTKGFYFITT